MFREGGSWIPDGRAKTIVADCEASLAALDGPHAVPLDRALDTADVDEIGADAEDHARPRSMDARMVFTA